MEIDVVDNSLRYEYKWALAYDSSWQEERAWRANKLAAEGWRVVPGTAERTTGGILVLMEREL